MEIRSNRQRVPGVGEIYLSKVGADKIRPIVVIGGGVRSYRYLEFTTRKHQYRRQVTIEGFGLNHCGFLCLDTVFSGDNSELQRKVGQIPLDVMQKLGLESIRELYPVSKNPMWYGSAYGKYCR